jgi:murein tripeptide amidase MpaA
MKPLLLAAISLFSLAAPAQFVSPPPSTSPEAWLTPAEKANYRITPDYAGTMDYLRRVADAAPRQVRIEPFGRSGEGRELDLVIASRDGVFDPARIHAAHRPIVLVQNAIHAGEMDGKDACMALLRDMVITRSQAALLDRAVFVFIPIYNPDGHERRSAWNRINQNGPEQMGWRANATNLNLNRDYLKADAPETRAFLAMFHRWLPDFFVDDHVTDGADFQYDVTYTIDDGPNVFPATARWIDDTVIPGLKQQIDATGHLASPTYITLVDDTDAAKGLGFNDDPPRFSTGYMILENRPGMLVEMHMLKDYKTRVTGNYETLVALLTILNRDADKLIALNADADRAAEHLGAHPLGDVRYPLAVGWNGETTPFLFRGYKYVRELSEVSGGMSVRYTHEPWNVTLPLQSGYKVTAATVPPAAYIVPGAWTGVIAVLAAHQVEMHPLIAAWTGPVETYRCRGMQWQEPPYEGRHPIFPGEGSQGHPGRFGQCVSVTETMTFPAGSQVVPLDQRLSQVALQWLEPQAPDSAMAWNFFDSIFEQKEYGEAYVLEKLARTMMAKDPRLREEFERKVAGDPKFAADPEARLDFFYDHSPWLDPRLGLYPVGRLTKLDGLPISR